MDNSKYSPDEILQILNDFYNCQSAFDPEVFPGEILTFKTTISDWRNFCDLVEPKKLARCYHDLFALSTPIFELENMLLKSEASLNEFCRYIADNAVKQSISPILTMGQYCMSAAIFKTLTTNLEARGVDIQNIRPSTEFKPLFRKHGGIILEEVSKLAPGSLSKFKYVDNWISKTGSAFFLLFFFSIIIVPIVWHFHWLLLTPLVLAISLLIIGHKLSPAKEVIGGYDTIRDLIIGMQSNLKTPAN